MAELVAAQRRSSGRSRRPSPSSGSWSRGSGGCWRSGTAMGARIREQRGQIDGLVAGGLHPFFLIEHEYRLALETAERDFVERLLRTLDDEQLLEMWRSFHRQSAEQREKGRKE